MRRKIDVSVSEMRHMREMGMTNHEIAKSLDISTQTVYRYLGKRSFAVANAAAQNKPCPVNFAPLDKPEPIEPEETTMDYNTIVKLFDQNSNNKEEVKHIPPTSPQRTTPSTLQLVKETHCYNFSGKYCDYEVDTGASSIVMSASETEAVVNGIIDIESIPAFIEELRAIYGFVSANHAPKETASEGMV